MRRMESGVSEAIGFVIILALVFTGIGLVTLYGYPVLMQQESYANLKNTERTMIVIQNDIKSLTYSLDNFKETDFQVGGGAISVIPNTPQTFNIYAGGNTPISTGSLSLGEIRYFSKNDNAYVAYENGAVIEKYIGQNATILASPRWYMTTLNGQTTLVINLVDMLQSGALVSSTGAGAIRSSYSYTNISTTTTSSAPITLRDSIRITYNPDNKNLTPFGYAQAWRSYLTDTGGLGLQESSPGSNIYIVPASAAPNGINNVVVKRYDIYVGM